MARVTVEDCLQHVDNRFQLVLVATRRARRIALGAKPLVDPENDKPTVIALREIAEGLVTKAILDEEETEVAMTAPAGELTDVNAAEAAFQEPNVNPPAEEKAAD